LRIVFVVHTFFPSWTAGTEVYTKSLARKVIDQGHEAFVVCYEPPAANDSFEGIRAWDTIWDGLPVHRISFCLKYGFFQLKDYFHREVEDLLLRYLSRIRPDVVHVTHAMYLTTASIWATKRLGLPVVSTTTDFWYVCPTYQLVQWDESLCRGPQPLTCLACVTDGEAGLPIRRLAAHKRLAPLLSPILTSLGWARIFRTNWLPGLLWLSERRSWMKKTLAQVDVLLAPTPNTARLITQNGLKPKEMRTSGFGLEAHLARVAEARPGDSVLRVGFIGTFRRSKGLHVLLAAMGRLPQDKVRLDVYGAIGRLPEYDQMVRGLAQGLENVFFRGTFPNEKLPDVFAGFDVLVIPSLWYENSPLVLLSAFALKTPVVASKVGSLADLVEHGKNGLLFEMGNAEDLANQLRKLAVEPELVNRLRAGIPEVRMIDENIDELLDVYARLARDYAGHVESIKRPISLPRAARWCAAVWRLFKRPASYAEFGDRLTLVHCKVNAFPQRELHFDYRWHAREVAPEWAVFVHLVDEHDDIQIQDDHQMFQYDQDPWGFITYRRKLCIGERHWGKSYRVRLGVWSPESKERLPVVRSRGMEMEMVASAVSLGVLEVL
jgi:glycosyltransferase involved in cell wall biosynthesis